jgi:hypothetical protein
MRYCHRSGEHLPTAASADDPERGAPHVGLGPRQRKRARPQAEPRCLLEMRSTGRPALAAPRSSRPQARSDPTSGGGAPGGLRPRRGFVRPSPPPPPRRRAHLPTGPRTVQCKLPTASERHHAPHPLLCTSGAAPAWGARGRRAVPSCVRLDAQPQHLPGGPAKIKLHQRRPVRATRQHEASEKPGARRPGAPISSQARRALRAVPQPASGPSGAMSRAGGAPSVWTVRLHALAGSAHCRHWLALAMAGVRCPDELARPIRGGATATAVCQPRCSRHPALEGGAGGRRRGRAAVPSAPGQRCCCMSWSRPLCPEASGTLPARGGPNSH